MRLIHLNHSKTTQQLIQAAQAGNTDRNRQWRSIERWYVLIERKNDSNGYHTTFSMTVKDGKVTESNYDNVNADGKSKKMTLNTKAK